MTYYPFTRDRADKLSWFVKRFRVPVWWSGPGANPRVPAAAATSAKFGAARSTCSSSIRRCASTKYQARHAGQASSLAESLAEAPDAGLLSRVEGLDLQPGTAPKCFTFALRTGSP